MTHSHTSKITKWPHILVIPLVGPPKPRTKSKNSPTHPGTEKREAKVVILGYFRGRFRVLFHCFQTWACSYEQRCWRSFFFGSTIRSRSFCQKWIYNPIRSFHPPEKRIYDPILSDPIRSFPIRSLSCILKDTVPQILRFLKSHDISNDCKISQNYDFTKKCQF